MPKKQVTFNQVVTLCTYRRVPKDHTRLKPMRRIKRGKKGKTRFLRPDLIIYTHHGDTFTDLTCSVQRAFDALFTFVEWIIK